MLYETENLSNNDTPNKEGKKFYCFYFEEQLSNTGAKFMPVTFYIR
ncbi:cytochrome C oxidase assembly protein [Rickettsia typhi str. B9991CWPP]